MQTLDYVPEQYLHTELLSQAVCFTALFASEKYSSDSYYLYQFYWIFLIGKKRATY